MITPEERRELLAARCPHCRAAPGERCSVVGWGGGKVTGPAPAPRTLEGGFHDARWLRAVGRPAEVVAVRLPKTRPAPVPVPDDRPW